MNTQTALLQIFNQYQIKPDKSTACLETSFGLTNKKGSIDGDIKWSAKAEPRMIASLGITAPKALANFCFSYKKRWRMDKVASKFYDLSDNEILDMFNELPFFLKAYSHDDKFMPTAEAFLGEKLWKENYPNKPKGVRVQKNNVAVEGWDEYLATVPEDIKETYIMFREQGMTFETFKGMMNG